MKRIFSLFLILSVLSFLILVGCVNNKTIVAEVDTDRIRLEHFEQMSIGIYRNANVIDFLYLCTFVSS